MNFFIHFAYADAEKTKMEMNVWTKLAQNYLYPIRERENKMYFIICEKAFMG